jgi:MYXO-CTERM domain-containing protein
VSRSADKFVTERLRAVGVVEPLDPDPDDRMKLTPLVALAAAAVSLSAQGQVNLGNYTLTGRYALPEPTRDAAPANSLLAQEASAVTWNRDTNTLFVVGDGGTSIVQVDLTGQLIDSMTLGRDPSKPQGTAYYDPEGLTYVGNGKFVMVEERDRVVSQFTYAAGITLGYGDSQHVKLGTTVGNIGIEGISADPLTGGFIAVKEKQPAGVFLTKVDFAAGTATNGSATTANSTNLFDPALTGLLDFADVYAMSNVYGAGSVDNANLLILSQESGKVIKVDRSGNLLGTLTIPLLPGVAGTSQLSVVDQQHEGITMDAAGNIYLVSENGGGDINNPQLWVFSVASVPEPEGFGLGLAGLGAIGLVARRRRTTGAQARAHSPQTPDFVAA